MIGSHGRTFAREGKGGGAKQSRERSSSLSISAVRLVTFPRRSFFGVFNPSPPCSLNHLHCNEEVSGGKKTCFLLLKLMIVVCKKKKEEKEKENMPWCTDNIDSTALNIKGGSCESVTKLTLETLQGDGGLIACLIGGPRCCCKS